MRRLYNISDVPSPKMLQVKSARPAKTLRLGGSDVRPGRWADVPDHFPLGSIGALIQTEMVSVDSLPEWYQAGKEKQRAEEKRARAERQRKRDEEKAAVAAEAAVEEEPPKTTLKRRKKKS